MSDRVAESARAAALRLQDDLGPDIVTSVEAVLHDPDSARPPVTYADPIALGSLIVSVATLAWTVYQDLRRQTETPSTAVVRRTLRVEIGNRDNLSPPQRDRVIEIVVDEVVPRS